MTTGPDILALSPCRAPWDLLPALGTHQGKIGQEDGCEAGWAAWRLWPRILPASFITNICSVPMRTRQNIRNHTTGNNCRVQCLFIYWLLFINWKLMFLHFWNGLVHSKKLLLVLWSGRTYFSTGGRKEHTEDDRYTAVAPPPTGTVHQNWPFLKLRSQFWSSKKKKKREEKVAQICRPSFPAQHCQHRAYWPCPQ